MFLSGDSGWSEVNCGLIDEVPGYGGGTGYETVGESLVAPTSTSEEDEGEN